jgi:hypothetical protein
VVSSKFAALLGALLAAAMVHGQEPMAAEVASWAERFFQPSPEDKPLACEVRPLAPELSYRLVYRAGYLATVSMDQLTASQRGLGVLIRVTPRSAGARPLLMKDFAKFPQGSGEQGRDASKFEAQIGGGFLLGEGQYHAELVLVDEQRRICRKGWDLELKPHKAVNAVLSPGQLLAFSQLEWPHPGARAGSLTVLVNAGKPAGNRVLLDSLAAILEQMAFSHVQVVAFSLDQRTELLRQEVAGAPDLRRVEEALNGFNPATVSYDVLRDPAGLRSFLARLLAEEEPPAAHGHAVLFLGYPAFDDSHVAAPAACTDGSRKTLYAYFDFVPPAPVRQERQPEVSMGRHRGGLPEPTPAMRVMPDAISRITRACSGKVYHIFSPSDLAAALQATDQLLPGR